MDQFGEGQDSAPAQPPEPPPGQRGQGFADGVGTLDQSTGLLPSVQDNIKIFFGKLRGPLAFAFIAASSITVLIALVQLFSNVAIALVGVEAAGVVSIIGGLFAVLLSFCTIFSAAFQSALYRPARNALMVTPDSPPETIKEAVSQALPALVPAFIVNLLVGLLVGLGTMCCVAPGVIAFIMLAPARYLVVARGMSIGEGLSASLDIGKKYWGLMLAMMLASGVIFGISAAIGSVVTLVLTGIGAAVGGATESMEVMSVSMGVAGFIGEIVRWVLTVIGGVLYWSVEGGIMATIEAEEYDEQVSLI